MRLYIIRHADPDYPGNTITPAGHLEAQALAQRLAGLNIGSIFCSPLPRAVHTAQYTAELIGLEPAIQPWMAELEGWEGDDRSGRPVAAWNVDGEVTRQQQRMPEQALWSEWPHYRSRQLQDKYDLLTEQSDHFLASLGYVREGGSYRIVQSNRENIAIFCHLGFGLTWLSHLLEFSLPMVWSGFWLAPSSVTTILMDERSEQWATPRCLGLGETSHLYKAGLPVSKQGIITNFD